jgi:hypothetical protein
VCGDDCGKSAMTEHGENAVRSTDARNTELDRMKDVSQSNSLSDVSVGKDLEEFLRAVYEAQSRQPSI